MNENRLDRTILEVYGSSSFFKVKADSFGINKVQIDFVSMDGEAKSKQNISFFVDIYKALALANDIQSGRIGKLIDAAKKDAEDKGLKYPPHVWQDMGGVGADAAKKRKMRDDGKAVSRTLSLIPGEKQPFVFNARQSAGIEQRRGAITPDSSDKSAQYIIVPFDTDILKAFALGIQTEWDAFIKTQYMRGMFNYKSSEQ